MEIAGQTFRYNHRSTTHDYAILYTFQLQLINRINRVLDRMLVVFVLTYFVRSSTSAKVNFIFHLFRVDKAVPLQGSGLAELLDNWVRCLAVSVLTLCILTAMPEPTLVSSCFSPSRQPFLWMKICNIEK